MKETFTKQEIVKTLEDSYKFYLREEKRAQAKKTSKDILLWSAKKFTVEIIALSLGYDLEKEEEIEE